MEEQNLNLNGKAIEDYRLVQLALGGDSKSYALLLARYKNPVYYMLLKMVNSKADAEDLTLEAFSKAFKNLDQYIPTFSFSTWLFKIASNNCIDFLRRQKGIEVRIDEEPDSSEQLGISKLKSREPNPEERLIRVQRALMLRKLVGTLKPRYQRLIDLRYFHEYSYDEIAKELNLPVGTVKAHLFRARELLFERIGYLELDEILSKDEPHFKRKS